MISGKKLKTRKRQSFDHFVFQIAHQIDRQSHNSGILHELCMSMDVWANSREKWRKCISVTGSLRGQVQVRPINKLDEARTNADDQMMLVQHYSGDRVMSYRGFDRIS